MRVFATSNSAVDLIVVFADCSFPIYIPGAFTPNYDGLNDVFCVLNFPSQHLLRYHASQWHLFYMVTYTDIAGRYHGQKGTLVLLR